MPHRCASAPAPAATTHRAVRLALARSAPGGKRPCHAPGHEGARGASRPLQALKTAQPIVRHVPAHHPSSEGGDGPGRTQEAAVQKIPLNPCEKRGDPDRTPQEATARCAVPFVQQLRKAPPTPRASRGLRLAAQAVRRLKKKHFRRRHPPVLGRVPQASAGGGIRVRGECVPVPQPNVFRQAGPSGIPPP